MCFTAPEVFIHSVARRTREHTKCVPSRRSRSPFCEPGGRGRTPHPFYGFFCLRIGSTIKNVRGGLVRSAAFPAPRFSDLISAPGGSPFCEPGKRGRSCMPFRLAFDCPPQIFCRFLKNIFGFLHSGRQHSSNKPGAEAPRLKDFLFHNHLPKTRQLRFILHAFGTRPVRIRAPRPIGPHRTQLAASAHTQCIPSRRSLSPFCKNRGRESTHSVFHRAGGFHSFRGAPDARARRVRSVASLSANRQHNRNTQTRVCSGTSTDRLCLFPRLPAIPDVKPFPTDAVRRSSILLLCFCFRFCFCLCFGTFRIRWYTVVCTGVRPHAMGYGRIRW